MSDTPAMSRPLGGADEFERRMRMIGKPEVAEEDPLSELARLIGQDDPFKGVFGKSGVSAPRERTEPVFAAVPGAMRAFDAQGSSEHNGLSGGTNDGFATFGHDAVHALDQSDAFDKPIGLHGPVMDHDGGQSDHSSAVEHDEIEQSPDAWAQGEDLEPEVRAGTPTGSTGRTLIVLAAVVVLTSGGLAASFLARPSGAAAGASAAPPTILAASGPSKVQPPASPTGDDGQSEPSTLLDKNKNDGTATAKVVNSAEQPVDLSQAVRPAPGSPDASSPFPEPHKVRTVVVRADGSIAAVDGAQPAAPTADLSDSSLAFDSRTSIPMPDRSDPSAAVTTDDAASPVSGVTPKVPAPTAGRSQTQAAGGGATPAAAPTRPKLTSASIHTRPKSKPVEEASLTTDPEAAATVPASGGGFAVQLGAPPTSQEARDAATRLQKKFADQLGSYRPSVHEAKSGDKSVFRIRVGSLSQDQAKELCSKLQAAGGACFVARN